MALVIAAMSCSFYVACGDDDVIIGNGGTAGTGGSAGRGGTGETLRGLIARLGLPRERAAATLRPR